MEDLREQKPFIEMSNKELFCVLTGDRGIMAQALLQKLIRAYMDKYPTDEDVELHTMVETMIKEEEE